MEGAEASTERPAKRARNETEETGDPSDENFDVSIEELFGEDVTHSGLEKAHQGPINRALGQRPP